MSQGQVAPVTVQIPGGTRCNKLPIPIPPPKSNVTHYPCLLQAMPRATRRTRTAPSRPTSAQPDLAASSPPWNGDIGSPRPGHDRRRASTRSNAPARHTSLRAVRSLCGFRLRLCLCLCHCLCPDAAPGRSSTCPDTTCPRSAALQPQLARLSLRQGDSCFHPPDAMPAAVGRQEPKCHGAYR